MQSERLQQLLSTFPGQRLVVVGDVMLDTYYWGSVSRLSPEAPVPIVMVQELDYRPGGAANVAHNLLSLGAQVDLVGITGEDSAGRQLEETLAAFGLQAQLLTDPQRPTTQKTRVIAGSQHLVRLDQESDRPIQSILAASVCEAVGRVLPGAGGLILQDYHKGTLTSAVIQLLQTLAREQNCRVFVDPKTDHLDDYHGVSLLKPNLAEAEHFVGRSLLSDAALAEAGHQLREMVGAEAILITRGSLGMDLFDAEGHQQIPTRARQVADVSGAGDTVISTYALAVAAGASPREAAIMANFAAGTVVERMGVIPVTAEMLGEIHQSHAPA